MRASRFQGLLLVALEAQDTAALGFRKPLPGLGEFRGFRVSLIIPNLNLQRKP